MSEYNTERMWEFIGSWRGVGNEEIEETEIEKSISNFKCLEKENF